MKKQLLTALAALTLVLGTTSSVRAFDTGHHSDLTREALGEFGCNNEAIKVAQIENWLVDYYSNEFLLKYLEKDLARLHFDNLTSPTQVKNYWAHLANRTASAVRGATKEKDALKILALTGMSLHAVQDFYTHSNWVEARGTSRPAYDMTTYFDAPNTPGLHTGRYPNHSPISDKEDHGDYEHGMNHDGYGREYWDRAYVYAYSASVQWVGAIRNWVEKERPGFWEKVQELSLTDSQAAGLSRDSLAAYRLSQWVASDGANGHWKGKGSGSKVEFVDYATDYAASIDSVFAEHFKNKLWHREILPGGDNPQVILNGTPPALPVIPQFPITRRAVVVRTLLVEELPVDLLEARIDPGGSPDFVARLKVDGKTFLEGVQIDRASVQPYWTTITFVPNYKDRISIQYELFDEDASTNRSGSPITSSDDLCDINPSGSKRGLEFTFNPATEVLFGDVTGKHSTPDTAVVSEGAKPQSDRARVKFYVTTRPLLR